MNEPAADGSGAMFDGIARRYDLLNRVLSLGLDRRWRRLLVGSLDLDPGAEVLDVARILVNTPSTQGALGGMYNTLTPSFTLSCGTGGNSTTTENISARQLLNIHRICRRRDNQRWMSIDKSKYLDESLDAVAIEEAYYRNT